MRALASALASYDGAAELDRGLDLLLIGLTATPPPRPATNNQKEQGGPSLPRKTS